MTKKEILDYIMKTPYNSNRQVLQYILDDISGGSGEGNIPLPEYESEIIDPSDNSFKLNLNLDDVDEDFMLIKTLVPDSETDFLYMLINKAGNGIVFGDSEIVLLITEVEKDEDKTLCYITEWPPQLSEISLGSCSISLREDAVDAVMVFIPILQYSNYNKPWLTTKQIPVVTRALEGSLNFEFFSDGEGDNKPVYLETIFLQNGWNLGIDPQASVTNAEIYYDSFADQYYLGNLTNGDSIVLYLNQIT